MKKKPIFLLTAAVLLGCVFGAGCISYEEVQEYAVKFDSSGGEETVTAKAGDIITITTEGNPTTGYDWTEPVVSDGLDIIGWGHITTDGPEIVGAGTIYDWDVSADKPGTYTFTTEYKRAWEDAPISTITVTIIFS